MIYISRMVESSAKQWKLIEMSLAKSSQNGNDTHTHTHTHFRYLSFLVFVGKEAARSVRDLSE